MNRWKQTLLLGTLGILGACAGLLVAILAFGPATLLGMPGGQWAVDTLFGRQTHLPDGRAVVRIGRPVPAWRVSTLDGQSATIAPGGKPLLINYWASWCPPCVKEMPLLEAFSRQQGETGIQVHGIALDAPEAIVAFLERHPVSFPVFVEASGPADSSMLLGNARSILPYSVLVDAQGRLLKTKVGAFSEQELAQWGVAH